MCPREHGHWLYRSLVTASKAERNLICFIGVIVFVICQMGIWNWSALDFEVVLPLTTIVALCYRCDLRYWWVH